MRGPSQSARACATDIIEPTAPKWRRRWYQTTMQKEVLVGKCAIRQDVRSTYYDRGAHVWRRILLGGAWCFQNCCSFSLTHEIMYKFSCTNHKAPDNTEFTCHYRLGGPLHRNTSMEHPSRLRFGGFFKIIEKFTFLCNSLTHGISKIKQFTYSVTLLHVYMFNSLRFIWRRPRYFRQYGVES
jgi:hypothetical protein